MQLFFQVILICAISVLDRCSRQMGRRRFQTLVPLVAQYRHPKDWPPPEPRLVCWPLLALPIRRREVPDRKSVV